MLGSARFVNSLDRLLYMRSLSFLGDLGQSELAVIAEHMRERSFKKGENLLTEGQPVGAIHLVVDGKVEASRGGRPFRVFGERDAVGVMGLLAGTEEGVQAKALTNTVTLELRARALHDVFEDHFSILDHVLRHLTRLLIAERKQLSASAGYAPPEKDTLVCPDRPLDFVERMFILRNSFPTTTTSLDALAELSQHVTEHRLESGTILWRQGDRADHMFLVLSGKVVCTVDGGKQQFVFGSDSSLGSLGAMARDTRWYEAVTGSCVTVLRIETENILDVFEDHFQMAMGTVAAFARQVLQVFEQRV